MGSTALFGVPGLLGGGVVEKAVVHGEGLEAGLGDVGLEELRLFEAGDEVGGAVEDEDGEAGEGAPKAGEVELGPLRGVGGG